MDLTHGLQCNAQKSAKPASFCVVFARFRELTASGVCEIVQIKNRYRDGAGKVHDVSTDMTELTYEVLAYTLFSGDIAADDTDFADDVDRLLSTMGRVDPLDLLKAPEWLPRLQRLRGRLRGPVYGPLACEVQVRHAEHAPFLEQHVPRWCWNMFVVTQTS